MELRHIRYFVRAAELLHFTHAAESLYISQPTLSTHIHQLEEELGLPLFDRVGRNVRLTQAGSIFLDHSLRALRDLDKANERIADLKGLVSGTLRIGALLIFGRVFLPSWIASFHALYPQIQIEVSTGTSEFIIHELQAGLVDLALSTLPSEAEEIEGETLFSDNYVLIVTDDHKFAQRSNISMHDLREIPIASVSKRATARNKLDVALAGQNIAINIVVEIDDLQALLKIASNGKIATLLASRTATNYPNVRLIPITDAPRIEFGVLWHKNQHLSPVVLAFLDHIRNNCCSDEFAALEFNAPQE